MSRGLTGEANHRTSACSTICVIYTVQTNLIGCQFGRNRLSDEFCNLKWWLEKESDQNKLVEDLHTWSIWSLVAALWNEKRVECDERWATCQQYELRVDHSFLSVNAAEYAHILVHILLATVNRTYIWRNYIWDCKWSMHKMGVEHGCRGSNSAPPPDWNRLHERRRKLPSSNEGHSLIVIQIRGDTALFAARSLGVRIQESEID